MNWIADECPDANGFTTIRIADGSANGDTDAEPSATVYNDSSASLIVAAPAMRTALTAARDRLSYLGDDDGVILCNIPAALALANGASPEPTPLMTAASKARDTLREQMQEMCGDNETEWRETVFWDAYSALQDALA